MTTAAAGGSGLRHVHRAPGRLRVTGGSPRLRLWHRRLALGGTLAGAMVGALAGVVLAFLRVGVAPLPLLEAYGAGAALGAGAGLAAGVVLGVLVGLTERYLLPQVVEPHHLWVKHTRR